MAAGTLMPSAELRRIYEQLLRDGVMVVKKDRRPQSIHPDVRLSNLKVMCAMRSLRSRAYIRQTFTWKHAYYYLTNGGMTYLRDHLHLPQEITPAPLQRVGRTASSSDGGLAKYDVKPQSQEDVMGKNIYRHTTAEEEPRRKIFRGFDRRETSSAGQDGARRYKMHPGSSPLEPNISKHLLQVKSGKLEDVERPAASQQSERVKKLKAPDDERPTEDVWSLLLEGEPQDQQTEEQRVEDPVEKTETMKVVVFKPKTDLDPQTCTVDDHEQEVVEKTIYTFDVSSETSSRAASDLDCPNPECPVRDLKSSVLQRTRVVLMEELQEVQRVWSDLHEGLSWSLFLFLCVSLSVVLGRTDESLGVSMGDAFTGQCGRRIIESPANDSSNDLVVLCAAK